MSLANPSIEDLDALIIAAREYKAAIKRRDTAKEKMSGMDWKNTTERRMQRASVNLAEKNHLSEVAAYALHAACVNADQSNPLGACQYEPRDYVAGPMHRYEWTPAKPRIVTKAA